MTEQQIQSKIIKSLKAQGWLVIKIARAIPSGVPDLLALKDGQYKWIEVKTKNGKLSKIQDYRIKELEKSGGAVSIWQGFEEPFPDKGEIL